MPCHRFSGTWVCEAVPVHGPGSTPRHAEGHNASVGSVSDAKTPRPFGTGRLIICSALFQDPVAEQFRDLDRIQRRALAQVVGDAP